LFAGEGQDLGERDGEADAAGEFAKATSVLRIGVGEERSRLNSSVFPSGDERRSAMIMESIKAEGEGAGQRKFQARAHGRIPSF
jgi:hypothetical protein